MVIYHTSYDWWVKPFSQNWAESKISFVCGLWAKNWNPVEPIASTLNTDLANSNGDGTLSALCGDNSNDSDLTIPYEYASTYEFSFDDHISDFKSAEFDTDGLTFDEFRGRRRLSTRRSFGSGKKHCYVGAWRYLDIFFVQKSKLDTVTHLFLDAS